MKAVTKFIEGLVKPLDPRNPPADFENYQWGCWNTPPDKLERNSALILKRSSPFLKYFLVPKELININ
jgi:hypothetical protein